MINFIFRIPQQKIQLSLLGVLNNFGDIGVSGWHFKHNSIVNIHWKCSLYRVGHYSWNFTENSKVDKHKGVYVLEIRNKRNKFFAKNTNYITTTCSNSQYGDDIQGL